MKMTTVGIDLAKTVFQIHGEDDHGKPVLRKKAGSIKDAGIFYPAATLFDWNGSLWQRALLVTKTDRQETYRQAYGHPLTHKLKPRIANFA